MLEKNIVKNKNSIESCDECWWRSAFKLVRVTICDGNRATFFGSSQTQQKESNARLWVDLQAALPQAAVHRYENKQPICLFGAFHAVWSRSWPPVERLSVLVSHNFVASGACEHRQSIAAIFRRVWSSVNKFAFWSAFENIPDRELPLIRTICFHGS